MITSSLETRTRSGVLAAKVFGTCAVIVPLAVLVQRYSPARGHYPLWAEIIIWHFVLCSTIVVFGRIVLRFLDLVVGVRAFSVRLEHFFRWLSIWPVLGCAAMLVLKLIGVA